MNLMEDLVIREEHIYNLYNELIVKRVKRLIFMFDIEGRTVYYKVEVIDKDNLVVLDRGFTDFYRAIDFYDEI